MSQLGIGIDIGNISTLATFTSVGVGEWNWRFENLVRKILSCPLTPDPNLLTPDIKSMGGKHLSRRYFVWNAIGEFDIICDIESIIENGGKS